MQVRRSVVFALVAIAAVTCGALLAQPPQAVGTWASFGEIGTPLPSGATGGRPIFPQVLSSPPWHKNG